MTSVLVLPHPKRGAAEVKRHQPGPETEATAMRVVMDHERDQGRHVEDVSANNLGYAVTSLDTTSGDLRLIEVKGLAAATGTILLTPNSEPLVVDLYRAGRRDSSLKAFVDEFPERIPRVGPDGQMRRLMRLWNAHRYRSGMIGCELLNRMTAEPHGKRHPDDGA